MTNTMRHISTDQFWVWADGHIGSSKTSIKVFHITDPFLGVSRRCQGKLLYSSDSEKRCNQVAEWMREAQAGYLSNYNWEAEKSFKNNIQRITDSDIAFD